MRMRKRYQLPAALFLLSVTVVLFGLLTGCANLSPAITAPVSPVVLLPGVSLDGVQRRAVVFGLDQVDPAAYGGWKGDCPGTLKDAARMKAVLERRGYAVVFLTNNLATSYRVVSACVASAAGMKRGDKLYVYGSSHGGQVVDLNGDEAGGKDSTICLWNGQFIDDLVWAMLLKVPAGVEVDLVTDCCNSGTNYRSPHNYVPAFRARSSRSGGELKCSFTAMGGCGDGLSSYGSDAGGEFTNALLATGPDGKTRIGWFDAARKRMPRNQVPVYSEFGMSVKDQEAMK